MLEISLLSRLNRCQRVLNQLTADTTILLNLDDGEYFALDGIGGRVWELCDGDRTVAEVVTLLAAEFDAPEQVIQDDVFELAQELVSAKLMRDESSEVR